ncbi:MAG: hypothetical protein KC609_08145, partial [Myxococcales bacterium]|nr:hypothetical protein [Myxococcales bacterium]
DAPEQLQRRGEPWRGAFDLVMHDAFSPRSNPECWSDAFLHSIAETCTLGALLLSFSVASRVRRTLESERFDVRKPKGFGHKRERLWACKRDVPQKREEPE